MATNKESLIVRLRAACNGLPGAVIAWPHRILHEAAEELAAANARIAELEARCAKYKADSTRLDKLQESFIKGEEFHIVMCEGKNEDEQCEHDTHPHFEAFDWSWRSSPVRASTLRGVIDKALTEGQAEATIADLREQLKNALVDQNDHDAVVRALNLDDESTPPAEEVKRILRENDDLRERLGEIDDATRDYYQNGETLLARIQRIVAELGNRLEFALTEGGEAKP